MPRKLRVQYPGAIYHVMNRGDRREPIFEDDQDRDRFLQTLGQACQKTGWQVHAYCLMSNHFHLVVKSYGQYLKAPAKRASWLRADRLLGEWGIPKDSPAGRRQFGLRMEERRRQESPQADWKAVERGWCLGDKTFKEELLAQMGQRRGDHYGAELREADALHAEKVLKRELRRRGWREEQLERRRKGDAQKVELAWCLRQETTMTLKWIAQRLSMGTWTHVSNCLVQRRKEHEKCK